MPRVKIDYVVSFSNEDPENQASNLLSWDVSKKKWLCSAGEPSCSAVLQLARAVQISSVQIGVHHAALVEVLVGRSETPNEPFQVLVPSCVFVGPGEARGAQPVQRVRSFSGAALAAPAAQRWDRLRLVCSQPYNKHCKYGISFIHIFEPEGEPTPAPAPAPALPPRMLALDTFSSDDEDFRPGELFAKHRQSAGDTGAQIRQATSQALKNNPDAAKLLKTPHTKKKHNSASSHPTEPRDPQRDKDDLMYTEADEQPHAKIDHVVQRHKDAKSADEAKTTFKEKCSGIDKIDKTPRSKREEPSSSRSLEGKRDIDKTDQREIDNDRKQADASTSRAKDESRKRSHSDIHRPENAGEAGAGADSPQPGPESDEPLRGVVFVLSGYQNPRRAQLRALALSLGARAARDWGPACTHLICAFSKTPKLAAVRAGAGGARVPAPTAAWLEACARRRRLLPWRWFAAEPQRRLPRPPEGPPRDDECDPDDEIERVRRRKKARTSFPDDDEDGDPVEFVKDERMQGNVTVEDSSSDGDTDEEGAARGEARRGALPAPLAGLSFVLDEALTAPLDARLLARYCVAYGGLALTPPEAEDGESSARFVMCGSQARAGALRARGLQGAPRLRAHWLWACHARAALVPLEPYLLTDAGA